MYNNSSSPALIPTIYSGLQQFETFSAVATNSLTTSSPSTQAGGSYSQHRRQVKSLNRLNYLQYTHFDFGSTVFLTLTISDTYVNDKRAIYNAKKRLQRWLRRRGIKYYIIAKEYGALHGRLHYHLVIFQFPVKFETNQQARDYKNEFIVPVWRIGFCDLERSYNKLGGVFYVVSYAKKGVNLQFSRAFFKERLLSNNVYYLLGYNKDTKKVGLYSPLSKIFGAYVSKFDYEVFTNRTIPAPVFVLRASAWCVYNSPPSQALRVRNYKIFNFRLAQWRWAFDYLNHLWV